MFKVLLFAMLRENNAFASQRLREFKGVPNSTTDDSISKTHPLIASSPLLYNFFLHKNKVKEMQEEGLSTNTSCS